MKRTLITMGGTMQPSDFPASLSGLSPSRAAARCAALPGLVFFDSADAEDTPPGQRWSLLAAQPVEVIRGKGPAAWLQLEAALTARRAAGSQGEPDARWRAMPQGGFAAGWVEYDGALCFGIYEGVLAYRHATTPNEAEKADQAETPEWRILGQREAVAPLLSAMAQEPPEIEKAQVAKEAEPIEDVPRPHFRPLLSREAYLTAVRRAQESIAAGDIYQVNMTHPFTAEWSDGWSAYEFYERLRVASPSPYAAYLSLGGRAVLSSSPELFLKIDGRKIETRPIKGTRPRGSTEDEDAAQARELTASLKEAAELVMITDLERNDLGQICDYGTVHVRELLKLERYPQVFHLVSTVEGQLRREVSPVAALRACFPGGSITGAPKKRAREIISELEAHPRGLYTGAIGYFGFDGQTQFNIAIRTVIVEGKSAHFHVGAGIVADSSPEAEWEETLHKARGILLAAER